MSNITEISGWRERAQEAGAAVSSEERLIMPGAGRTGPTEREPQLRE